MLGAGVQEYESRQRVGFRFVRIELFDTPQGAELSEFSVRASLYPVSYRGYFHCSDPLLNRIWEAGRKTLHLCMQEYYLDGVKRDRFLWVGDTRAEALYNYYLFGDQELFRFCWEEIASVQYADEILILDDDHIAGQGTHEELLASNKIYQEIYQSQQEGVSIDG